MRRGLLMYHEPVLLQEAIEGLNIKENGVYVDCTYGGGGYSREILKRLGKGKLIVFDVDEEAAEQAIDDDRLIFVQHNFRYLNKFLKYYNALPADGIIADLGVSSHQIDTAVRGFSTRFDAPLDMRMSKAIHKTAAEVLNQYNEQQLADIFYYYGDLRNARKLARLIVTERKRKEFEATSDLMQLLKSETGKNRAKFFAKVFQALRIEVNEEIEALKDLLEQSPDALKIGGRLVVIAYHSLEDRLVKNMIKRGNMKGEVNKDFYGNVRKPFMEILKKPISASEEEVKRNPRARSAKLRIGEKIQIKEAENEG